MEALLEYYNIIIESITLLRVRTQSFDHVAHFKIIYQSNARYFVAKINVNFADNPRSEAW